MGRDYLSLLAPSTSTGLAIPSVALFNQPSKEVEDV